jgi:hypothetical protein
MSLRERLARSWKRARVPQVTLASLCFLLPLLIVGASVRGDGPGVWHRFGLAGEVVTQLAAGVQGGTPTIWAVCERSGLWQAGNSASSWSLQADGFARGALGQVHVDAIAPARSDADATLSALADGDSSTLYALGAEGAWRFLRKETGGRVVRILSAGARQYVVSERTVSSTTDGGATWGPSSPWGRDYLASAAAVDPWNPQRLLVGTRTGEILASEDGGQMWDLRMKLPLLRVVSDLRASSVAPGVYWMAAGSTAYRSEDYGRSWLPRRTGLGIGFVSVVLPDPASADMVYVAMDPGGVYRSTDGGTTWVEFRNGLGPIAVRALMIDPADLSTLLGASDDGVWAVDLSDYRAGIAASVAPGPTGTSSPRTAPTATGTPVPATATRTLAATPTAGPTETSTATQTRALAATATEPLPTATWTATALPTSTPRPPAPPPPPATAVPPTSAPPTAAPTAEPAQTSPPRR